MDVLKNLLSSNATRSGLWNEGGNWRWSPLGDRFIKPFILYKNNAVLYCMALDKNNA
ncbi:MAG: hypothetical protein ACI83P_001974 [Janthinobacterium sp.]|jgi:hypothetical protein